MQTPQVLSVNLGRTRPVDYAASLDRTAIDKRPVDGAVWVGPLGLEGDEVADTRVHGGVDQAVYAYAREDLAWWAEQLGGPVPPGRFGENLTTTGIDVNEAALGERWRVGTALLEVCHVRIPCATFRGFLDESGYDATRWVKRFTAEGRPGPYLRVVEEGEVAAGDAIELVSRPDHGLTVSMLFRALTTEQERLPNFAELDVVPSHVRERARRYGTRRM